MINSAVAGKMDFSCADGMSRHVTGGQLTAFDVACCISFFRPKTKQTVEDMLSTIKSEKEEHGALDIETIRSIDVPSYVSGRSYSHLGEIAKYRKRALDQIIRYIGYLEQIHAPAEYLEQVNVLQESVSDLTIKTKDLKPFRFRL